MARRLGLARGLIALMPLAFVCCGGQTTSAGAGELLSEVHTGFRLEYVLQDRAVAQSLVPMIDHGRQIAEQFFATTYASSFVARVLPDRVALTARWREAWNQPGLQTECWMIAAGWATEFDILSPSVWSTEACGHDGGNSAHVANIIGHELVHVLHAQRNSNYTALASTTPWLTEGMATFASGQWASDYASAVRPVVSGGFAPESFAALWASQANYALAGSVFAYISYRFGANTVRGLLSAHNEAELLTALSTDAPTLLRDWRAWILAQP